MFEANEGFSKKRRHVHGAPPTCSSSLEVVQGTQKGIGPGPTQGAWMQGNAQPDQSPSNYSGKHTACKVL